MCREFIDYKTAEMSVDIPPFPEWNSGHYIEIPGEGIVFTGEKSDDGSRCYSGVIESHYSTDDWRLSFLNTKTAER